MFGQTRNVVMYSHIAALSILHCITHRIRFAVGVRPSPDREAGLSGVQVQVPTYARPHDTFITRRCGAASVRTTIFLSKTPF
jgi:hypothetical protein